MDTCLPELVEKRSQDTLRSSDKRSGDVNPSLICSSGLLDSGLFTLWELGVGFWELWRRRLEGGAFSASSSYSNLVAEPMQVRRQYWEDHLQRFEYKHFSTNI